MLRQRPTAAAQYLFALVAAAVATLLRAALTPLGAERQAAGAQQMARVTEGFTSALLEADRAALERIRAALR